MTELALRETVVKLAEDWLGYKESDGSVKTIIDCYNSHKPLASGYVVQYTDPWCATFGSAVAIKAGLTGIIPTECSCTRQIALFESLGAWMEADDYVPQLGDYIFYDWDDSGTGENVASVEHVGIVTKVEGASITVIEGNKGNAVDYRSMTVNGRYIRGYGIPNYASLATDDLALALESLSSMAVINSPDYWATVVKNGAVPYLDALIIKAAAVISERRSAMTVETAVGDLVDAGVIGSPDYWLGRVDTQANLDALLLAFARAL